MGQVSLSCQRSYQQDSYREGAIALSTHCDNSEEHLFVQNFFIFLQSKRCGGYVVFVLEHGAISYCTHDTLYLK